MIPDLTPPGVYIFETVAEFADGGFASGSFEIEVVE